MNIVAWSAAHADAFFRWPFGDPWQAHGFAMWAMMWEVLDAHGHATPAP